MIFPNCDFSHFYEYTYNDILALERKCLLKYHVPAISIPIPTLRSVVQKLFVWLCFMQLITYNSPHIMRNTPQVTCHLRGWLSLGCVSFLCWAWDLCEEFCHHVILAVRNRSRTRCKVMHSTHFKTTGL